MWFLPGHSSGHQLLGSLFNSPWAWDCVIVGFMGGVLAVSLLWGAFALGSRNSQYRVRRGANVVGSRVVGPSTDSDHHYELQSRE